MSLKACFCLTISMSALLAASSAPAQSQPVATSKDQDAAQVEKVVVTGVTAGARKRDATFSINTLKTEDIQRPAPISTVDLLANIPGLYSEASNNVTVRGLAQFNVANLTNALSFTEGDPIFSDLLSPDGTRNRGVGRPLFGRAYRASLTYRF